MADPDGRADASQLVRLPYELGDEVQANWSGIGTALLVGGYKPSGPEQIWSDGTPMRFKRLPVGRTLD